MFQKIIKGLKKLKRTKKAIDPSQFNDPIAMTTSWSPAKSGGASFCTHTLIEITPNRIEFKAAKGAKIFFLFFVLLGIGAIVMGITHIIQKDSLGFEIVIPFIVGIGFVCIGAGMFYSFTKPIVFDKHSGHFWKGKKDPAIVFDKNLIKVWTQLGQIHALQLISERCSGRNSSYSSYELNLVLNDGSRINVIDHGNLNKIREDANILSGFLGKPIWDAI